MIGFFRIIPLASLHQNKLSHARTHLCCASIKDVAGWGGTCAGGALIVALFYLLGNPVMGQVLTVTHTASDFNGYNISCFGKVDGAIDITITGGTAPYSTQWTHGPTTPDVANLPAGYYAVVVMDADSTLIRY